MYVVRLFKQRGVVMVSGCLMAAGGSDNPRRRTITEADGDNILFSFLGPFLA
jgi:hypothetical protein